MSEEKLNYDQWRDLLLNRGQVLINKEILQANLKYEPGVAVNVGLDSNSVGAKRLTMGYSEIPPKSVSRRHIHKNCECGFYVISGTLIDCSGPEAKQQLLTPGTFMYIPQGSIHGGYNPSETETTKVIFVYAGVPNKEAAGTVPIDDDPAIYPPKKWITD